MVINVKLAKVNLNGKEYICEITYKKCKYLRAKVKNQHLIVTLPNKVSSQEMIDFLQKNQHLLDKYLQAEKKRQDKINLFFNTYVDIMDSAYQILPASKSYVSEDIIYIHDIANINIYRTILNLFSQSFYQSLYELTLYYYEKMNISLPFPKIQVKYFKSKYGAYNKKNHLIQYSSVLIMKPTIVYNYIVVHELAHILEFNHSKKFYQLVEQYCPDYKRLRKILKEE